MPDLVNEEPLGGHAVTAVGYDLEQEHFIVRNSWGVEWGDAGYFYMPFAVIDDDLAADFWTLRA
jgi:C1A family cysteine protease